MAPPMGKKGEGYAPLDLESSINTGQWRTIEEHERLQQGGVSSSSTSALEQPSNSQVDDFYAKQRQGQGQGQTQHYTRKKLCAWIAGGCALGAVVLVLVMLVPPLCTTNTGKQQQQQATGGLSVSIHNDTGQRTGSRSVDERGSKAAANSSTTGTSSSSSSATPQGLWHEGGGGDAVAGGQLSAAERDAVVPCKGPNLQCAVVNKQPIPEADFRNLPRRSSVSGGMVASDNSRCSQIGRDVLRSGGNAVDAAVATALCLGVVNPVSSGLGGGAFITVRLANGTAAFYDARETAPAAATEDMYKGLPSNASLFGALAVAVPGELQGLGAVWKRFGSKPWAELVKPAAELARTGFAFHPYLSYIMGGKSNIERMKAVKALRETFLIQGPNKRWRAPNIGELCCRRPKLAATLDKIASEGPSYLTSPAVTAAHAKELSAAGGKITAQDLAEAKPLERELLRVQLGELELLVPPPPSSAAVVAFALKFLAGYNNTLQSGNRASASADAAVLASFGAEPQRDKALGMHRLVEALKHGFAVRTALGDPGSKAQPYATAHRITAAVSDLLNDTFIDQLRAATHDDTVLEDTAYGGKWNPKGESPPEEHGTSHFGVVDAQRNAVSMTTSINTPFGSGVISDTTGILFGNTMDDFSGPSKSTLVTPHPTKANFIAPGKRPLSAMSPIIVSHKASGRLVAVAGASGGPLIVSATTQTLARLLLEGADVSHAVGAPRLHDQLVPNNSSFYENYTFGYTHHQMPAGVVKQLQARDQLTTGVDRGIGVSQAIYVDYDTAHSSKALGSGSRSSGSKGVLVAASDSRKDGAPLGYDL